MRVLDADNATIADAVTRLVTGAGDIRTYANGCVPYRLDAREVYSYGTHFPLFRYVPRRRRVNSDVDGWRTVDSRRPALFVINGDSWTGPRSRTPDHQTAARAAIARTGIESIVIPFSALDGAGIDIDSVRPLHVRADENWTETVARRTLAELPVWRRTYADAVPRESATLDGMPRDRQSQWRKLTDAEIAARADAVSYGASDYGRAPTLPDADGVYRWDATVTRQTQPDADGIYRWDERRHRLGDALFTATRAETSTAPALPFQCERETARETVTLMDADGRRYCTGADTTGVHVAGPGAACIYCGGALRAQTIYRRRARYLSSFDTNEPAPLYFLCEVSRNGAPTVDGALDSLAPRAVHAAILAGVEVRRQGDIFLIDTALTTETLADRGAVFGRFTLMSRGAKPRAGEITYRAPNRERDKAVAVRERRHARRLWRETWRDMSARAYSAYLPDADRRERSRELWRELTGRHALERAAAAHLDADAPESSACPVCGAGVGEGCHAIGADGGPLAGRLCGGIPSGKRCAIAARHDRERDALRRETRAPAGKVPPAPYSGAGTRARWREIRARHATDVTAARVALRRAVLAGPKPRARNRYAGAYNESIAAARRNAHRYAVLDARGNLERALASGVDSAGNRNARHARDAYRARYGTNALALWDRALDAARLRYRPDTVFDAVSATRNRAAVRRHLSIYGTAHSASNVARVGGAVYVQGTVRHAVELEPARFGGPDHIPVRLTPDRWYLAVRNTVPRQSRRRRRQPFRPVAGS
jgi:hypothetical protein